MNPRAIINKTIILSFFVAAGYLLARSFYYGSFLGIVLAVLAVAAWTYFLYQLNQMKAGHDPDTVEELPN